MYQHDVSERVLTDKLAAVVQDCVAEVGVELNTASEHLLRHVSGQVLNINVTSYYSSCCDAALMPSSVRIAMIALLLKCVLSLQPQARVI
jgi:hypothetical protein